MRPDEEVLDLEPLEEVPDEDVQNACAELLDLPCVSFFAKTFSRTDVPTLILDAGFTALWANAAYHETFFEFDEVCGRSFFSLFNHPNETQSLSEIYRTIISAEHRHSWSGRLTFYKKGKRSIVTQTQITPIFPDDASHAAKPSAYTCFSTDITSEYFQTVHDTFMSLLEASVLKDKDTGNHVKRVNHYSRLIAETFYRMNRYPEIDIDFIEDIGYLAAMHDVGKIGTPDDVLNKEGKLESWEWEIMKEHTINGAYILSTYPNPMAREITLFHHEKWDGSGYPYGFSADMIPLSARIVALADVYDALRSKRSYKESFAHGEACRIIEEGRGKHFDPEVVDIFLGSHGEFNAIFQNLKDG